MSNQIAFFLFVLLFDSANVLSLLVVFGLYVIVHICAVLLYVVLSLWCCYTPSQPVCLQTCSPFLWVLGPLVIPFYGFRLHVIPRGVL